MERASRKADFGREKPWLVAGRTVSYCEATLSAGKISIVRQNGAGEVARRVEADQQRSLSLSLTFYSLHFTGMLANEVTKFMFERGGICVNT